MSTEVEDFKNQFVEAGLQRSRGYLEAMATRRSVRQFSRDPVSLELILTAVRTAGLAPSGANSQPWFFAVIQDAPLKERIRIEAEKVEKTFYEKKASAEWLNALKPFATNASKPYLSEAPCLIAVFSRHRVSKSTGQSQTYYPLESVGLATGLLVSSLHLAGLSTLTHTPNPMAFLNDCLKLDRTYKPFMLIVAGYPKIGYVAPEISKKDLNEICTLY